MAEIGAELAQLAQDFEDCRKLLIALGDENRQHLILEMVRLGRCTGVRVGELAAQSHLSRPAVSHHLQILKDAGILKMRREGTRNYYYFDEGAAGRKKLLRLLERARAVVEALPDRSDVED